MHKNVINIIGKRFGKLTVVEYTDQRKKTYVIWKCVCDCGKEVFVSSSSLRKGGTKSCGCARKGINYKHGHSKPHSSTYNSWSMMRVRCQNSNHIRYKSYGKRGIKVCNRWKSDFRNFLKDMGERPEGLQLDRINNDGNYEPGNCRWVTPKENCNNRRRKIITKLK